MPWWLSDGAIAVFLALVAVVVTMALAFRDRFERQLVLVDAARTRVEFQEGTGKPHRASLSLLSTGNRATVIRDITLVGDDGARIRSYRLAGGCEPALPIRLDAPDERVVILELTSDDERELRHIEVEFLGGMKPVEWPYVRMSGVAAGSGSGSGPLTAPAEPLTGQRTAVPGTTSTVASPPDGDTATVTDRADAWVATQPKPQEPPPAQDRGTGAGKRGRR